MVRITEHDPEPASASPRDAEAHKLEGNRAFGEGRFEDAERHYTAALEASASTSDEGASDQPDETRDASARREDAREDDRATGAGTTDGETRVASSGVRSNEEGKTTTSRRGGVDRARTRWFAIECATGTRGGCAFAGRTPRVSRESDRVGATARGNDDVV